MTVRDVPPTQAGSGDSPLRVAVLHNLDPGGAHRRLGEQIRHLGADVTEICLETATPVADDPVVIRYRPAAPGRPRVLRPPLRYRDLHSLVGAWKRAAEAANHSGCDVVYANPCSELQAPAALLHMALPSVYFCDEPRRIDYEPDARATLAPMTRQLYGPLRAAARRLDRRATAEATRIVTNSRYTAGRIAAVYGRSADVLPMGVPDGIARVVHDDAPGAVAPILSVGTLIPDKGHALVIESAARARSVSGVERPVTVVAPRANLREAQRLQRLAEALAVPLSVRIGITDAELAATYRSAHVTVYLSRLEPLGLVALEAQAAGCPVIVAAEGGLPETIIEGRTGWAVPRSAEAAAQRISALERTALRDAMSASARRHGAAATWKRSGRVLRDVLVAERVRR